MSAEQEYSILSENIRHYDTTIFALVTVSVAVNGALATLFTLSPAPPDWLLSVGKKAGLVVALVFWANMEIFMYRFHHFLARAAELEGTLGFKQYSTMLERRYPSWWMRPGSWAWRALFGLAVLFWAKSLV